MASDPELPTLAGPAPKPGKYIRVSIQIKKRPDVSFEYFSAYWANNHVAKTAADIRGSSPVKRYNQVRPSAETASLPGTCMPTHNRQTQTVSH